MARNENRAGLYKMLRAKPRLLMQTRLGSHWNLIYKSNLIRKVLLSCVSLSLVYVLNHVQDIRRGFDDIIGSGPF